MELYRKAKAGEAKCIVKSISVESLQHDGVPVEPIEITEEGIENVVYGELVHGKTYGETSESIAKAILSKLKGDE